MLVVAASVWCEYRKVRVKNWDEFRESYLMKGMVSCGGFVSCHATAQSGPGHLIVDISISHTIKTQTVGRTSLDK